MRRLNIHRHLTDVMLDIRILDLVLRGYVLHRVVERGFRCSEKRRGIMRNKTGLPPFLQILAGITNDVRLWNKRSPEMDQMAGGRTHPDRIPPGGIDRDRWVGKIA